MRPSEAYQLFNSAPFPPCPRFERTVECTLDDILTTEESAARDAANLDAVRQWLHDAYLTT